MPSIGKRIGDLPETLTVEDADNLEISKAGSSGSYKATAHNLIGTVLYPILSGETGVTDTLYPHGDIRRYGATGDGVTDDSTAVMLASAAVGVNGRVTFPAGYTYRLASMVSCAIDGQVWVMYGAKIDVDVAGVGIRIGTTAAARVRHVQLLGGYVFRHGMDGAVSAWTAGDIGVQFVNTDYCRYDHFHIEGFDTGIQLYATNGQGQSYFTGTPRLIRGCRRPISLYADTNGFTNENTFEGNGSISLADADPAATTSYFIHCDRDSGTTANVLNGNKFRDMALESAKSSNKPAGAIYANCEDSIFDGLRYEGFTSPFIVAGPDWVNGGNQFRGGSGLLDPSIIDFTAVSGATGKYVFLGHAGHHIGGGSAAVPLLVIEETNGNTNTQLQVKDATGTVRYQFSGSNGQALGSGGVNVKRHQSGSKVWDPPSIADGATTSTTVAVPNAALGDVVAVGFSTVVPAGALLVAAVTASGTVTVTLYNKTGATLDLASGTLRASVWQY